MDWNKLLYGATLFALFMTAGCGNRKLAQPGGANIGPVALPQAPEPLNEPTPIDSPETPEDGLGDFLADAFENLSSNRDEYVNLAIQEITQFLVELSGEIDKIKVQLAATPPPPPSAPMPPPHVRIRTRNATCKLSYTGSYRTAECTATCNSDEIVTGGGSWFGSVFSDAGRYAAPSGNGFRCGINIRSCSSGSLSNGCNGMCYAICTRVEMDSMS